MDDHRPAKILNPKQRIALIALAFGENRASSPHAPASLYVRSTVGARIPTAGKPSTPPSMTTMATSRKKRPPHILAFHDLADVARSTPSERARAASTLLAYLERGDSANNSYARRR